MKISYSNLFKLLEEKGITKTELRKNTGMSTSTLAKLSKNEMVSMQTIEDICNYLNCQVGDVLIMEREVDKTTLLYRLIEEKNMRLKGGLYHQTQIMLAYNSNHMEGSTLTEDQTRYIFETNTIGLEKETAKVDDIIETMNHFMCFDYMLNNATDDLSEVFIKKLHEILKTHTSDSRVSWFNVGEYKQKPNVAGGEKTTQPSKVKAAMRDLMYWYHQITDVTIEDIVEFHWRFEKIHPFQDGNGRVGRLIMFKECLKHDIVPFVIEDRNKLFYYRGIKNFHEERGWLIDTCLAAQDNYKMWLDYFKETE